ncbi:hypothetical protein MVEN_01690700 [Mycena venus]|uniref:Uncharacterized protein n=1 Tax=Mycena venus TaxID=2733690 RepID=A0A8H6XLT4_9AGAR|nr:hypothetical protein MVEN_01690700 [Mycena venus]
MGLYGAYSQTGMGWISASLEQQFNVPRLSPTLFELDVCNLRVLRFFTSLDTSAQFTSLILRDLNHFSDVSRCLSGSPISSAMVSLTLENCDLEEGSNFPRLSALRHLHIRHRYEQVPIVTMAALACSLDHPFWPRALETIDLIIDDAHEIDNKAMNMAPWRKVDAVFAGADSHLRWPNLRRLAVRGLEGIGIVPENISVALRQNMPVCVARGILVIL